jgi:hypothetical protein
MELGPRYRADRGHAPYKESRICFSCDPVNQWVMRKDTPGEARMRYGKLLTRLTARMKTREMAIIWVARLLSARGLERPPRSS